MSSTFPIAKYIIATVIVIAFGYALFATHTLWRGPVFVYLLPRDKTVTDEKTTTVEGHARRAQTITINGYTVTQDLEGYFAEEFALLDGENRFTVTLTDKFNHIKTREIRVIKQKEPEPEMTVPEPTETLAPQAENKVLGVSDDTLNVVR